MFLSVSIFLFLLIPFDALAVYLVPASGSERPNTVPIAFAQFTDSQIGTLSSYQDAIRSSRAFGVSPAETLRAAAATPVTDLILKGIVELSGRDAIIENLKSKRTMVLERGDRIEGYTLKEIGENFIILSDGQNDVRLKIEGQT